MKTAVLVGAFAGLVTANIKFHYVTPGCDFTRPDVNPCLKGQSCTEANTYVIILMHANYPF